MLGFIEKWLWLTKESERLKKENLCFGERNRGGGRGEEEIVEEEEEHEYGGGEGI